MTQDSIDFIEGAGIRTLASNVEELIVTGKEGTPYFYYKVIDYDIWEYRRRFIEMTNNADNELGTEDMSIKEKQEYASLLDFRLNGPNSDTKLTARMNQYVEQLAEFVAGL